MTWPITLHTLPPAEALPPLDWEQVPFGRLFSRHVAQVDYQEGRWQNARIEPLSALPLHPGTSALHYGQAIFEGLKAYKRPEGTRFVFRMRDHAQRLNRSATRLVMPEVPLALFEQLLLTLLQTEAELFPPDLAHALYIRPVYFATDPWLGVRPSETFKLLIYLTPVGPYYSGPVRAYVETEMVRAAPGGTGAIKMAGNYAAALLSGQKAQTHGCQVSLWLDAIHRELIEEFSTMNVFFVRKGPTLLTPSLQRGTILPGITRDTLLHLARTQGIPTEERDLSLPEILDGIAHGEITEVFGTGTAATIMPLTALHHAGKLWELPPAHPVADSLLQAYKALLSGEKPTPSGWIWTV